MSQPEQAPRLRVLHVDDFDEFLEEFRALFGQDLDLASLQDPRQALALLETESFDAVVVDYEMPEMDGLAFMEAVKAKWPLLPVIFCTGQGSEEVARRAFTSGAADYFVKDFSFFVDREKLLNSLRRAVQLRSAERRLQEERRVLERDNGIGIDPEHLDRIFDMSFTTDRRSHFGLGLSLVKKIVDAHGGQVRAESRGRGQGTSFHLRLPLPLARRRALAAASPTP